MSNIIISNIIEFVIVIMNHFSAANCSKFHWPFCHILLLTTAKIILLIL